MTISDQFKDYCNRFRIDYDALPEAIQQAVKRAYFGGFTDCIDSFGKMDNPEEAIQLVEDYTKESVAYWFGLLNSEN